MRGRTISETELADPDDAIDYVAPELMIDHSDG
jgi:hypothetical protein